MMKKIIMKFLKKDNPEYVDIAQEILSYADLIETESLSIAEFSNMFTKRVYRSNLFSSTIEISLMCEGLSNLLEVHFGVAEFGPIEFANRMRQIIFQFSSGVN